MVKCDSLYICSWIQESYASYSGIPLPAPDDTVPRAAAKRAGGSTGCTYSNQLVLIHMSTQWSARGLKFRASFCLGGLAVSETNFRSSEPKVNACSSVQLSVAESRAPKTFASAQCAKPRKRSVLSPERSVAQLSLTSRPRHARKRLRRSLTRLRRTASKVRTRAVASNV